VSPNVARRPAAGGTRPRVAIALYADLTHDRRVQREAVTLSQAGYDVTIAALESAGSGGMDPGDSVKVISWRPTASQILPGAWSPFRPEGAGASVGAPRGGRLGWLAAYGRNLRSWGRWAVRSMGQPDVWHAVDLTGLAALGLAGIGADACLIYDSHELYLESGSAARIPGPARWVLARVESRLAHRAAAVITVNPSIAHELSRRYGVDPVVVMNCPLLSDVRRPGRMRARLALGGRPVLLHHGSLGDGRGIGHTIDALRLLPAEVALVLLGDGPLVPWIREQQERPELAGRLFWHPAVPLNELLSWVVDADLGVMLFEPTELNSLYATPNRLFDCVVAGVPVLASDFPEFRRIVNGDGIGEVCDPTDNRVIAESIGRLLAAPEQLAAMQIRARSAARIKYNWDTQAAALLDVYRQVVPTGSGQQRGIPKR
jgi:glycosyltransferase involved in cell wall biosynthesis